MTERRHPADRVAGDLAHDVGIDTARLHTTRGSRQLALVELVGPAHVGQDDLAVDGEDQRLHDLPDVDADG